MVFPQMLILWLGLLVGCTMAQGPTPIKDTREEAISLEKSESEELPTREPKGLQGSRLANDNGFGSEGGPLDRQDIRENRPLNRPFRGDGGRPQEEEADDNADEEQHQQGGHQQEEEDDSHDQTPQQRRRKRETEEGLQTLDEASQRALAQLLSQLNGQQRRQLLRLVSNPALSRNQLENATDSWAQGQSQSVQTAYMEYKQSLEQLFEGMEVMHRQVAANLSSEAQAKDREIMAILNNPDLNLKQQCSQLQETLSNVSAQLRGELFRAFGPLPCSRGGRGPHRGRGHHRNHGRGPFSIRGNQQQMGSFGDNQQQGGLFGGNQRGQSFRENQGFGGNQTPFGGQSFRGNQNGFGGARDFGQQFPMSFQQNRLPF